MSRSVARSTVFVAAISWPARSYFLSVGSGCAMSQVEGAPPHRSHGANRHRQQRHASARDGPPLPPDRARDDRSGSSSYFERHGLIPPRLLSRRRAQQIDVEGAAGNDAEALTESEAAVVPDAGYDYGPDDSTRLHDDLLENYGKHSYPWKYAWQNDTVRTGLPVEMNINFHRILSVDIVNSVMDLVVWFRLEWVDPRLTWKPEEYGGFNETRFWIGDGGSGGETSEIWAPDIELWNLKEGLKGSLEGEYAKVSHDGRVYWSRPGHLIPACKFEGLSDFPFHELKCTMEFGSWAYSGKYLRIEKSEGDDGFSVGGSDTAGESYATYSFVEENPVQVLNQVYPPYDQAPEEDWPVLLYTLTIANSWQPYLRGFVTMQVILNLIGFSAMWLPPSCGERMGLSVTSMLAAVASEIVVAANLPAASEMTWFSKFSMLSLIFAFVSLLECVVVLYFYDKRDTSLVPKWCMVAKRMFLGQKPGGEGKMQTSEAVAASSDPPGTDRTGTGSVKNAPVTKVENILPEEYSDSHSNECGAENHFLYCDTNQAKNFGDSDEHTRDPSPNEVEHSEEPNTVHSGKMNRRSNRETMMDRYRASKGMVPQRVFNMGSMLSVAQSFIPRDAGDFRDVEESDNNTEWKIVAARVDDVGRFWIPLAFAVTLAFLFAEAF